MTLIHPELGELGDSALAELTRENDTAAFAELWRRHAGAGTTAARQFASVADPQDIVSEAYVRILHALQRGGGPHDAFRPYLYRTIRNIALDWRPKHPSVSIHETGDLSDPGQSIETTVLENAVTARAFEQLPERWQAVLWYLEVEGMSPSDAAPLLGLSPNATSALAARASDGFKTAWLQAHVNDRSVPAECQWTTERMGRYIRHSLTRRSRARFDRHVDECDRCALLMQEIGELRGQLASVLLPITLGATAGSFILGQLRDQAAIAASAVLPVAAPAATGVLTAAAAVVLVASAAVLNVSPVEQQAPPSAAAEQTQSTGPSTDTSEGQHESGPGTPDDGQPEATDAENTSGPGDAEVPDPTPSPEVTPDPDPEPDPEPVDAADPPLVDLSVSLLSGTVELDAVVDLNPTTGLVVKLLPGVSLFGG